MFVYVMDETGNLKLKDEKKRATQLTNIVVKNIAAVDRPANRRGWLLIKNADGSFAVQEEDDMGAKALTADDYSRYADQLINSIVTELRKAVQTPADAAAVVVEMGDAIIDWFKTHPGDTRAQAEDGVKKANPKLAQRWESYIKTVNGGHAAAMNELTDRVQVIGMEQSATAKRDRLIDQLMVKNDKLDAEAASAQVYREDPDLYEACRREMLTGAGISAAGRERELAKRGSGSAIAELNAKVDAVMAKGDNKMTREQITDQIYRENDGLYDRVRSESLINV